MSREFAVVVSVAPVYRCAQYLLSRVAANVHWLGSPPTPIVPLWASERQSGWFLRCDLMEKSALLGVPTFVYLAAGNQLLIPQIVRVVLNAGLIFVA